MTDTESGLVPKGKSGISKQEALVAQEPMDIPSARKILEAIVNTHESSIQVVNQDQLGGYSAQQIREAIRVVAKDLRSTHNSTSSEIGKIKIGDKAIGKSSPEGGLYFNFQSLRGLSEESGVRLVLLDPVTPSNPPILDESFPLEDWQ